MIEENENLGDAITALQEAFSEGASLEAMKKGEHVLSAMLTSLRGAMKANASEPAGASSAEARAPEAPTPGAKPAKPPDMIDFLVGFLKSKLDDEDRAAIESQAPPFSVPFIRM